MGVKHRWALHSIQEQRFKHLFQCVNTQVNVLTVNTHPTLMAFRLLSGEAVSCEAEIGKLAKKIGQKQIWQLSYICKM